MVMGPAQLSEVRDGRQPLAAVAIFRGVGRLLGTHGLAVVGEVVLANGRRADVAAWEGRRDLDRGDRRPGTCRPEMAGIRAFCTVVLAVAPGFPLDVPPQDAGPSLPTAMAARSCALGPSTSSPAPGARP